MNKLYKTKKQNKEFYKKITQKDKKNVNFMQKNKTMRSIFMHTTIQHTVIND